MSKLDLSKKAIAELNDAEAALRDASVHEVASGENDYDYRQMWRLLTHLSGRVEALAKDPTAFSYGGQHNIGMIKAWTGLATAMKSTIEAINKMRNSDKLTLKLLREHTVSYARAVAEPVSAEIKGLNKDLEALEAQLLAGRLDSLQAAQQIGVIRQRIGMYLSSKMATSFKDAAVSLIDKAKTEFKLHS